jgi:cytochrome bd-type quinol oxidase subunit 2
MAYQAIHPFQKKIALKQRAERVTWLLGGVVLLSLADLFLTLTYLTTVGMSEGNPIAHWLLETTDSVWPLAVYKVFTVAVCVTLLYRNRDKRQSELASWCAVLILVTLSIWWNQYSHYQPMLPYAEDHIVMVGDTFTQPFEKTSEVLAIQ